MYPYGSFIVYAHAILTSIATTAYGGQGQLS